MAANVTVPVGLGAPAELELPLPHCAASVQLRERALGDVATVAPGMRAPRPAAGGVVHVALAAGGKLYVQLLQGHYELDAVPQGCAP